MNELPLGTVVAVTIPRGMFPPEFTAREGTSISNKSYVLPKFILEQFILYILAKFGSG